MRTPAPGTIHRFVVHVVPGVIKPLRILWNQLIGLIFIIMAIAPLPSLVRNVKHFTGDADSVFRIAITSVFMCVMLYFGVTSFLRARRIERP